MHSVIEGAERIGVLACEAIDDLDRFSRPGVWTYPSFILMFFLTTDNFQNPGSDFLVACRGEFISMRRTAC